MANAPAWRFVAHERHETWELLVQRVRTKADQTW
jgi:hypothetical protein